LIDMSTSETGQRESAAFVAATRVPIEARIDPPHPMAAVPQSDGAGEASAAEEAELGDAGEAEAAAEQLRIQASQLAGHLRERQKELDHREAELNARSAELESDLRSARLWLSERIAELQERAAEPAAEKTAEQTAEQAAREESLRKAAEQAAREESLRKAAEQLAAKQEQLEEAEAGLKQQRAELQGLHEQLSARLSEIDVQERAHRERLEAEHRRAMAAVEEQRRVIGRRAEHVDRSRAAMDELHGQLQRLHRETLEIRLATEELWTQLSGAAPPAALVQSLGRIRGKLAEHHRLAAVELHAQQEELEKLRLQLAAQHEALAQEKRRFEESLAAQQKEAQQQASRLIARERQLDRRDAELSAQSQQWQVERFELQQELRTLRAELAALEGLRMKDQG
jgi:predicted protein tyrosine phosphatase